MSKTNSLTHIPILNGKMLDYVYAATAKYQPVLSEVTWLRDEDNKPILNEMGGWTRGEPILGEWRENKPFYLSLTWSKFVQARAAGRAWFTGDDGISYPMFMSDLDDILSGKCEAASVGHSGLGQLLIHAQWIGVKKGSNYGMKVYEG